jgi:hypothetical protein
MVSVAGKLAVAPATGLPHLIQPGLKLLHLCPYASGSPTDASAAPPRAAPGRKKGVGRRVQPGRWGKSRCPLRPSHQPRLRRRSTRIAAADAVPRLRRTPRANCGRRCTIRRTGRSPTRGTLCWSLGETCRQFSDRSGVGDPRRVLRIFQVRDGVVADQHVALGGEGEFRDGAVADTHVQLDGHVGARAEH